MKRLLLIVFLTTISISCRQDVLNQQTDFDKQMTISNNNEKLFFKDRETIKPLSKKDIGNLKKKLEKTLQRHSPNLVTTSRLYEVPPQDVVVLESEISEDLIPIQNQGKIIHQEILNHVIDTPEWNSLSEEDRNAILNYDDQQFSQLALVFTEDVTAISSISEGRIDPRIRTCVSSALGITALYSLYQNTMALGAFSIAGASMTTGEAIYLVGLIGKRYLGWIGVAWMVMDFVDCWNSF